MSNKEYIGDSVYVRFDGFGIWLTTENGYPDDPRNSIYLEPTVYRNLTEYVERLSTERRGCGMKDSTTPSSDLPPPAAHHVKVIRSDGAVVDVPEAVRVEIDGEECLMLGAVPVLTVQESSAARIDRALVEKLRLHGGGMRIVGSTEGGDRILAAADLCAAVIDGGDVLAAMADRAATNAHVAWAHGDETKRKWWRKREAALRRILDMVKEEG